MIRQESPVDQTANRDRTPLTPKLDKNLINYALAATAAGVGIMALAQTAEAKVIATQVNLVVPINGGVIQFDINGDGIPDFGLSATTFGTSFGGQVRHQGRPPLGGFARGKLLCIPEQAGNGVATINSFAAALPPNIQIGPGRHFAQKTVDMADIFVTGCGGSSLAYGDWKGTHPPHAYLPVEFTDAGGALHYGWVRISSKETGATHFNATIDGYAYETVPNKPIMSGAVSGPVAEQMSPPTSDAFASPAPKVASLGALALGARGLTAWRREEEQITA
ncbi:MAG: hypothetical protein ABSC33_08670 [Candidatus Sulfotelmatobacter sp.]|jgi:hypothetical protein